MMKSGLIFLVLILIFTTGIGCQASPIQSRYQSYSQSQSLSMKLTSPAFEHNANIPPKYTCDGDNVSPPLSISEVPSAARSLVLIVDDPDAPNGDWVHWLLWNMPAQAMEIPENFVPGGETTDGTNSFNRTTYGGPCPPSGIHHYHFKLFAVDSMIDLPNTATKKEVTQAINGHIIASNDLIGLYTRKK